MREFPKPDLSRRTARLKRYESVSQGSNASTRVDESPVYDARLGELFPLVLVNFVLNAITVGLYRFWAKTRLRRYFLSRISFLDDRMVYTGTGKELLVGFLVVLCILVPFFIGFDLLGSFAMGQGVVAFGAAQAAYIGSFLFLFHAAVYRAQRYRLSRITWRGIRGGQNGSALNYAVRAMAWTLLVALSLGLAYPLMRTNLVGYRIDNARFGQQNFRCDGSAGTLFAYWMLPWLSVFVLIGSVIGVIGIAGSGVITDGLDGLSSGEKAEIGMAALYWSPLVIGSIGLLFFAIFFYRAAEIRHFTGHTRFGDVEFESRLTAPELLLPYLAYTLLLLAIIGGTAALVWAGASQLDGVTLDSDDKAMMAVLGFAVVIVLLGMGSLLKPLIVQNLLVRVFCNNLTVIGTIELDRLLQSELQAPRRGEGLADAFDIDGF